MFAIGSQRHLFDIPTGFAYFNTATNAPQLSATTAALLTSATAKSRPWERTADDFFADADQIRHIAASLFGGDADGYAVIPATSYGLSAAARAIEPTLRPGDQILLLADEFPSNVFPWRRVAAQTGATIATVPTPVDGDWTAAILSQLRTGMKVASLGNCHWTNGASVDLVAVSDRCRDLGIILVLDLTQSLGAMPFDLERVAPDFMVSAGYKWLLCPYGFGLMFVSERWRGARPLEEGWLGRANATDFARLMDYTDDYRPGARRFDVGEACVAALPGAIAALSQLADWGIPAISESLGRVNQRVTDLLLPLGFALPPVGLRSNHILGARLPDHYSGDLIGDLRQRQIYLSQRGASLRFAPHLHVTESCLDQLAEGLHAVMR